MTIHEIFKELANHCKKGCTDCPYLDCPSGECMALRNIDRWYGFDHLDEAEEGRREDDEE